MELDGKISHFGHFGGLAPQEKTLLNSQKMLIIKIIIIIYIITSHLSLISNASKDES